MKINTFTFVVVLLFYSLNLSARYNQTKLDSIQNKIESIDSRVKDNSNGITDLHSKTSDAELYKKLEIIEKEIYDRDHKLTMGFTNFLLIVATIFFTVAFFVFGISWLRSIKRFKDENKRGLLEFKENMKTDTEEELKNFKKEIENKLEETEKYFYYHFGIKFFNKKIFSVAFGFFEPLYNSEFRQSDVRFYLARCYFYLEDYNKVVKYLEEALSTTDDNLKAYGIFYFIREILQNTKLSQDLKDEICGLLQNEKKNPKEYYKKNTESLIGELIDNYCDDKVEA